MSDGVTQLTLESLLIAGTNPPRYACVQCGVPKTRDQFHGESIACAGCAARRNAAMTLTGEDLQKTKFDLALEHLQNQQTPTIPGGVQKAHQILGGKTSSELLAENIYEIKNGKTIDGGQSFMPRDGKLLTRSLELLQRAEKMHDDFLKSQPPATGLTFEEAQSLSIDTFIGELTRNKALRRKVLGILYERVPDLIQELIVASGSEVVPEPSPAKPALVTPAEQSMSDLEEGGVL